ncbi:MAG: ADP-forming succinate--CoA ligase subunit beta [Myxococcales bacterium]|nr:ADP-forming succinate--CoA ligase subunit beta [Myxococcales bacterium]
MNIHEYQAKKVLSAYGVAVPRGEVAFTSDEAVAAAERLGGSLWVVKAQIHAGGRGKGGGVKLARSIEEVRSLSDEILGMTLVTHQTGPAGQLVRRIYVEEGADIDRELYLGVVLDREESRVCFMASTEGGMEIEQVAEENPEKILKEWVNPVTGLSDYQARNLAFGLGLEGKAVNKTVKFMKALYKALTEKDASLAEINPLIVTKGGDIVALDAKINFDSNALYRHPDIVELRDENEEDPKEIEASKYDLNYISLDGNIGCMVNGAGLAMGTMDIIKHCGGDPANFLDVGGGATKEKVTAGFKIILQDPNVKGIFVNIFGGIMKCDIIAEGVIAATKELGLEIPVVVRLEGTNVELGKELLKNSGLKLVSANNMIDGAQKIVNAVLA